MSDHWYKTELALLPPCNFKAHVKNRNSGTVKGALRKQKREVVMKTAGVTNVKLLHSFNLASVCCCLQTQTYPAPPNAPAWGLRHVWSPARNTNGIIVELHLTFLWNATCKGFSTGNWIAPSISCESFVLPNPMVLRPNEQLQFKTK